MSLRKVLSFSLLLFVGYAFAQTAAPSGAAPATPSKYSSAPAGPPLGASNKGENVSSTRRGQNLPKPPGRSKQTTGPAGAVASPSSAVQATGTILAPLPQAGATIVRGTAPPSASDTRSTSPARTFGASLGDVQAILPQTPSAPLGPDTTQTPPLNLTVPPVLHLYTRNKGGPVDTNPAEHGGPTISLEEAVRQAKLVDHDYVSAVVNEGTTGAQRTIARADILPNVDYHNQSIYTQPQRPYSAATVVYSPAAGVTSPAPIFIANNAVREYVSQGVVTETVGYGRVQALRQADAEAAAARARLEVARRGLVATVVGSYYGVLSANEKLAIAKRALDEANRFVVISRKLEAGGESSHADVLKAQIEQLQKDRDLQNAELTALRSRLDLGVLLFPDPTQAYSLATDLSRPPPLPSQAEFAVSTSKASPDVQAAMASLQAAQLGIGVSTAAYFPDLSVAYNYGIDSDHFAIHQPGGVRNLGYAATATVDIPVWDWFATAAKVKQSKLQRDLAKADLTATQRRTLAAFQKFYGEAEVASRQLASLERSVEDSGQALHLVTDKYESGEGTVLEVVDAQNTLTLAENARADGIVRYYVSLANLQFITGNLP